MHYCHLVVGLMAWKHRCSQIISLSRWHQTQVKQRSGRPYAFAKEVGRVSPALCLNIRQNLGVLPELILWWWWWSRSGIFFIERFSILPFFFFFLSRNYCATFTCWKEGLIFSEWFRSSNLLNMKVHNFGGVSGMISPASKVNCEVKTIQRGQNAQLEV